MTTYKEFEEAGRVFCVSWSPDRDVGFDSEFHDNAKKCKYRQTGLKLAESAEAFCECTHPEKQLRKSDFCLAVITHIHSNYPD